MSDHPQAAYDIARFQSSLDDLNERIARLAMALRVPLSSEAHVSKAIQELVEPSVAVEKRLGTERRSPARVAAGPERRLSLQRSELRALLVMRFDFETRLVETVGVAMAQQIMQTSLQTLGRHGFHPGDSGL